MSNQSFKTFTTCGVCLDNKKIWYFVNECDCVNMVCKTCKQYLIKCPFCRIEYKDEFVKNKGTPITFLEAMLIDENDQIDINQIHTDTNIYYLRIFCEIFSHIQVCLREYTIRFKNIFRTR